MATSSRQVVWVGLAGLIVGLVVGLAIGTTYSDQIDGLRSTVTGVWVEQPKDGGTEPIDY